MKSKPFLIRADGDELGLESIRQNAPIYQESWLQRLLQNHPQILPVDEIEPIYSPLVPIGREISTSVGFIDNLFISQSGYLVIVETKLWRNSEAKREVIAQAIDYGSALSKWSFTQLDNVTREKTRKGVLELIQSSFDLDSEEVPSEDAIAKNLRLGKFLILIVSEKIRESLIEMLDFANKYPNLATNVGLVELQCYAMPGNPNEIFVVPSIVAKTVIVERSIVQVTLSPEVSHQITVEQIKTDEDKHQARTPLSEDSFWELMQKQSPVSVPSAHQLLDQLRNMPEVVLKMRQTAVSARLILPDNDQKISLFFLTTGGTVECWPGTIKSQYKNAGLDTSIADKYYGHLSSLLRNKRSSFSIYTQVDKLDIPEFIAIVNETIRASLDSENKMEE